MLFVVLDDLGVGDPSAAEPEANPNPNPDRNPYNPDPNSKICPQSQPYSEALKTIGGIIIFGFCLQPFLKIAKEQGWLHFVSEAEQIGLDDDLRERFRLSPSATPRGSRNSSPRLKPASRADGSVNASGNSGSP